MTRPPLSRLVRYSAAALLVPLALGLVAAGAASGAEYPRKPIQLVVPYSAGGGTDLLARQYAKTAAKYLPNSEWQVVPMPGSGGATGAKYVADARPDGYTLSFGTVGSQVTTPLLYQVGYTTESFEPIAIVSAPSFVITVKGDSPINTLKEFVEHARANPGRVTYGSSGVGGSAQFAMELFARATGVTFRHVPFNGSAEANFALIGGHVFSVPTSTGSGMELIRAKQVKPLAVTSAKRVPALPDVPTVRELGYDYSYTTWRAVMAPKGTPEEVLTLLDQISAKVAADPEFIAACEKIEGEPPVYVGRAAMKEQIEREVKEHRELIPVIRAK